MPRTHQYSAWLLYLLIGGVYLTLAVQYPVVYIWMTYEDLYGEWLQTWLFFAVFVLATLLARRRGPYRWFFVFLAVAGFYTFGEEISWGQRIFGIESPEFFEDYNVQGETNLHNFFTGPESTVLKDVVEYTLAAALLGYGLFYPLLLGMGWSVARWVNGLGVAPPPLYLWMFFVNGALFEVGWFDFNEAEVAEIMIGTAMVIMLLHYLIAGVAEKGGPRQPEPNDAKLAAILNVCVFTGLAVIAFATTEIFLSKPENRERVESRVVNGYKKYAGRMERRGRWLHAADFYKRVYEERPIDVEMLRGAINSYQAAGDDANYKKYYRQLLDLTVTDAVIADTSVENQLALASNYAKVDEQGAVQQYLDRALFFGAERVRQFPDNPENYYWLGRAHQARGEYDDALLAYATAAEMDPANSRYSRAIQVLENSLAQ